MIRSRAEAMYAHDLTCQNLGITIDEIGPGHATLAMRVSDVMVNGHGIAHGGYLFLLADAAFAYASNSHGPVAVAQTAHMTFLRHADVGDRLVAAAVERSRHGRSGLYDVTVTRVRGGESGPEADQVIAEMRGQSVTLTGNPFPAQRASAAAAS
jgi:acyl-CoA thioesterase